MYRKSNKGLKLLSKLNLLPSLSYFYFVALKVLMTWRMGYCTHHERVRGEV